MQPTSSPELRGIAATSINEGRVRRDVLSVHANVYTNMIMLAMELVASRTATHLVHAY